MVSILEDDIVCCPVCGKEISVKILRQGKKETFVVSNACANCNTEAAKLENELNKSNKRSYVKVEKSYFKTDPRG